MTQAKISIVTYNCTNVNTSLKAITRLSMDTDIILLQEHWLYTCQLHRLKKLHDSYIGVCKAVDSFHPISPVQMPRGYGGVGVLWKKGIGHIINDLSGERIQYVELKADRPLLIDCLFTM